MMEELRSLLQDEGTPIGVLDDYDTGTGFKYTLSVMSEVNGDLSAEHANDKPGDPLSGNGDRKYKRKVTVLRTNEALSRQVFVRVYRCSDGEVLAETASVLRTLPVEYVPSQVYDVFVLMLENVPGWWVNLSTLAPMFDSILQDLESRDPGLVVRVHYITRLAYGRDPYYRPYINVAAAANTAAGVPFIYLYPGNINPVSFPYFVADNITANKNVDGDTTTSTAYPYSMADQYNHAVRQPDEERMYAEARAAFKAAGQETPEPSWRMLLDRMNGGPGWEADGTSYDYRNAIIINLHGEMLPMPPLRNYSDPAKRPESGTASHHMYRIVSHPENLRVASGGEVRLRVYPFVADPSAFPNSGATFDTGYTPTIVVTSTATSSANVRTALLGNNVRFLPGDATTPYGWRAAFPGAANDYDATVLNSSQTLVTLYNSPIRHAANGNYGLASGSRLYGLEYIPCVVSGTSFSDVFTLANAAGTLAENSATNAKNTARWVIRFPATTLASGLVTFETRLNATLTEGDPDDHPSNISRTYCWVGSTTSVPLSEQSQFIGDPRHMPYADVKASRKYNCYFKDVNGAGYTSFVRDDGFALPSGYGDGSDLNIDAPRFFEVLRKGLLNTTSIMSSINGWSFHYMGLGGEMGVDSANGYAVNACQRPWDLANGGAADVDEISGYGVCTNARIIAHSSDGTMANINWFGLHWIGELYPTMNGLDASAVWTSATAGGNLPTGNAGASVEKKWYFRDNYNDANLEMGTYNAAVLGYAPRKQPGHYGSPAFFDGNMTGSGNQNFNHNSSASNVATITAAGNEISQDFNFILPSPLNATSSAQHRPFSLNSTAFTTDEWSQSSYSLQRSTLSFAETYYDSDASSTTSALIRIAQAGQYGYFQPTGVATQGTFGTSQIGKLALVNVLRGFLAMGAPAVAAGNIPQVPLVSISTPAVTDEFNSPTSINIVWSSTWTRWDGQKYTSAYGATYAGSALTYNVKFTPDGGSHWYFINTTQTAVPGNLDTTKAVSPPLVWNVSNPAAFPQGNYDIRVEAYRSGRGLHFSYHQRRVYIRR